ncbi:MAG: ABC transporter permease [Halobacteriales archaeon]
MSPQDAQTGYDFDRIEWDAVKGGRRINPRDIGFGLALLGLIGAAYYKQNVWPEDEPLPLVGFWDPLLVDWFFFASLLIFVFYVLIPIALNWDTLRDRWRKLRRDAVAMVSLGWLALFLIVGTLEPVIVGDIGFGPIQQPPVGFSIFEGFVGSCSGPVTNGQCHGTLAHPFGTNGNGRDLLMLTIAGMRTGLQMALITATIIIPVGIGVGTVAGYFGGRVDALLMRYVDLQQTIPALFIYMALAVLVGPSLMLMVAVFGFLNWGNIARMVRSEVLQKRELEFVTAARSAGVNRWGIIRRHIVPNVAAIVVTATALKLPKLIIVEATLSYLKLGDPRVVSWGNIVSVGVLSSTDPTIYWWIGAFPIGALVVTAVAMSLFGNALQDVLDPRESGGSG